MSELQALLTEFAAERLYGTDDLPDIFASLDGARYVLGAVASHWERFDNSESETQPGKGGRRRP